MSHQHNLNFLCCSSWWDVALY